MQFIVTAHAVDRYCERIESVSASTARGRILSAAPRARKLRERPFDRGSWYYDAATEIEAILIVRRENKNLVVVTVLSVEEMAMERARDRERIDQIAFEAGQVLPKLPDRTPARGASQGSTAHAVAMQALAERWRDNAKALRVEVESLRAELAAAQSALERAGATREGPPVKGGRISAHRSP